MKYELNNTHVRQLNWHYLVVMFLLGEFEILDQNTYMEGGGGGTTFYQILC